MGAPLEAFAELLRRDDARIDLAHACLMIAQDAYPGLEPERYLEEIERMALRLRTRLPQDQNAEERVGALNQFLFDDLGYYGNAEDYYCSVHQIALHIIRGRDMMFYVPHAPRFESVGG